jgi:CheY-like chemotaxis protein
MSGGPDDYVLVVEDDEDIAALAAAVLVEELGLDVARARTGQRALELAAAHPPRLVLLDLSLPGISGLEVCRQLKAAPATRGVPIVILTAMAPVGGLGSAARAAGSDDWLSKPFALDDLLAVARRWIGRAV